MAASRALIVEDDAFIALGMTDVLTFAGFEVVGPARTVAEAIALGTRTRPDIAIIDDQLADRWDGIEVADLLHRTLGVSVVFLASVHGGRSRFRKKAYPGAGPEMGPTISGSGSSETGPSLPNARRFSAGCSGRSASASERRGRR